MAVELGDEASRPLAHSHSRDSHSRDSSESFDLSRPGDDTALDTESRGVGGTRFDAVVRYFSQPRWWLEIVLIWALYQGYSRIRNVGGKDVDRAFANGHSIMSVERFFHIEIEPAINHWVHRNEWVANATAFYYQAFHWYATVAVFLWLLFFHRRDGYRRGSLVLVITTLGALIGFYLVPAAPPRMYGGYVDIMAQTASWGWWSASGTPGPQSLTNEFAAMPSLHCGWALWCGTMIVLYARYRWVKVIGALYPVATAFVVVATANHYILDALVIYVIFAAAMLVVYRPWRSRGTDTSSETALLNAAPSDDAAILTDSETYRAATVRARDAQDS